MAWTRWRAAISDSACGAMGSPERSEARIASRCAGVRSDASSRPASATAQARRPGTGESVTKVLRPWNSARSSSTTCLMRKLPKETPRRPFWQFEIE